MFLNAALYQNLAGLRQPPPEVFCFDNIPDGIKHFAETVHVKADTLPTPEETEQIKKEQEALPLLRLLTTQDKLSIALTPETGTLRLNYVV